MKRSAFLLVGLLLLPLLAGLPCGSTPGCPMASDAPEACHESDVSLAAACCCVTSLPPFERDGIRTDRNAPALAVTTVAFRRDTPAGAAASRNPGILPGAHQLDRLALFSVLLI